MTFSSIACYQHCVKYLQQISEAQISTAIGKTPPLTNIGYNNVVLSFIKTLRNSTYNIYSDAISIDQTNKK